jgi:hypothetical protein
MADLVTALPSVRRVLTLLLPAVLLGLAAPGAHAQLFDEAVVDVGNMGLTVTNAGLVGNPSIRNNPDGFPSFEYPLDSGIEHLFEAGLWVGARRADGTISVRTGSVTSAGGYSAGAAGFEFAQQDFILERSSLPTSEAFTPQAISQQDFVTAFNDTARFVPGTFTPLPDPQGELGLEVEARSYAWSFPFTEYFTILEYEIRNISPDTLFDVRAGLWHDLVVRNIITTTDAGTNFFNKGGLGFLGYPEYNAVTDELVDPAPDSQFVSYAFNAGGQEETLNTYGAFAFLGAEWQEMPGGEGRFFHPFVAESYREDGYAAPRVNPRWWLFSDTDPDLGRPQGDAERYRRMLTPFPDPFAGPFETQEAYEAALADFFERLRTDGQDAQGNWIGMTAVGPIPFIAPGATLTVTFAAVAALKPEAFQGQGGQPIDTEESRTLLRNNVFWAQQTYAGEDLNYNGRLDPGEDVNDNGVLDRFLIPEPPQSPEVRVEIESNAVTLYWGDGAEASVDPVTGRVDFEGYRVYRSNPGDDLTGDIFGQSTLIAQYDRPGNQTGFNNGFEEIRLDTPVTFPGDSTEYVYAFRDDGLLNGWQYAYAVTAIDEGDPLAGLPSFESSRSFNAVRVFPGTPAVADGSERVGVYPNPYSVRAGWDGSTTRTRKLYFNNLPPRCRIRIYTVTGEIVKEIEHDAATYQGEINWFESFSGDNRRIAGGEHAWDLLSENALRISTGLYLFSVEDRDTGETQTGKFVIIQ